MRVRVRAIDFFLSDCRARLPFRFGQVTLDRAPLLTASVRMETETGEARGLSADLLVPKWFDKDPAKSLRQDTDELIASARRAADSMLGAADEDASVFDLWWRAHTECVLGARNGLQATFGVALLERAVMDAACRARGVSFFEALKTDLFGFQPGRIHPRLEDWDLAASLPDNPLESVEVRHTVGILDALRPGQAESRGDGLPRVLKQDIEAYGLSCFKIKLCGETDRDVTRLLELARLFDESVEGDCRVTVDGNEQFESLDGVCATFERVGRDPLGQKLLAGLLYVEQPLPRSLSFEPAATAGIGAVEAWAPVILDEADDGVMAFPRAIERGYRGISLKNCKGVFKGLFNRGLCELSDGKLFQSAEDLTNLPVLALQQDLTSICAHGLTHAERNGHHYFRGLDHLPPAEARAALAAHPDLYRELEPGVAVRIEGGRMRTASLGCKGFGYDVAIDPRRRTPLAEWSHPED